MSSVYGKDYGAVQFYDTDGNLLFDSVQTYGLWTSADTEPSPEPKWVRVSVPGADGAVDLSRALAGQVTYEQREIELQFGGKRDSHAEGLEFLRAMRTMLHGARVRISTVSTGLVGGYYVADTECDGTVYPDGAVVIDVRAWAEPFIRVGTQTLALPASTETAYAKAVTQATDGDLLAGAGYVVAAMGYNAGYGWTTPMKATAGRLWYACGGDPDETNVLDITNYSIIGYDGGADGSSYTYDSTVTASGHDITFATLDGDYASAYVTAFNRTGDIPEEGTAGIPFIGGDNVNSGQYYIGVYLTGTITSVGSSPYISVEYSTSIFSTDSHGRPTSGSTEYATNTSVTALSATTYEDTLVQYSTTSEQCPVNALGIVLSDISATNLRVRLAATRTAAGLPSHWPQPELGYVTVDFGGSFCHSTTSTDTANISPIGVTTWHRCEPLTSGYIAVDLATSYTTTGGVDGWLPEDAQLMCLSVTNAYGEDCPVANLTAYSYGIQSVTGTNGTMRSTPTVTSDDGAYVSIGGESMVVGSGTQELQQLTIGDGDFAVSYATLGGGDATLTWEGGVL